MTVNINTRLKHCPFCNMPGRVIVQYSEGRPGYKEIGPPRMHYVECMGCLARGPRHPNRDEAVRRWDKNKRGSDES